jgi:pimeloyl-ACP methyl ester carboxylesterase
LKRASLVGLLVVALVLAALAVYDRQQGPTGGWLAQAGLEPRFEQVDGLRLRYVRAGQGSPVLLLHGFSSSLFTWRELLPGLARQHDVVALDFPGFGGSQIPADLSPERLRRAARGLAQLLRLERPALVGHSMGGAVAAALSSDAALDPRRVVLIDAATFAMGPENRPPMVQLLSRPLVGSLTDLLPVRRLATLLALRQVFYDARLVTAERLDEYVAPLRRPGFSAATLSLLRANAAVEAEIPRSWAAARVPALVLWGRDDEWIPVSHAERHRAALPAARVVVLERCGHMPQEEHPAETLRLLLGFLADAS